MGAACGGEQISGCAPQAPEGSYVDYSGAGPWWACKPDANVQTRFAKTGAASSDVCKPITFPKMLMLAVEQKGDKPALKVERPLPQMVGNTVPPALPDEQWTTWTYAEYLRDVQRAARGFMKLGFQLFDTVNVWGFNSPEWTISAVAASFAGGKVGGLYPTDTPDTAAYKVVHSGGVVIVVEDKSKITKLVEALSARGDAKRIKAIVAWGFQPDTGAKLEIKGCDSVPLLGWQQLLELGDTLPEEELTKRTTQVQPGHCAALIYTSGTTGEPKAVMISHDNIAYEASVVTKIIADSTGFSNYAVQERVLCYLPLSHIAGMTLDICAPVYCSAMKPGWITLYFARPYDLKAGTIKDRLIACQPTVFLGVPLVWEKIADKIRAIGAANTGAKKAIGDWSKGVALTHQRNCQLGGDGSFATGHSVATKVLGAVKGGLGLSNLKFGFTGAAPIRVDTLEYFGSLDIGINEVYGMSECTGACTFSTDQAHQWGSCGFEMPGVEVKAFKVDETDFNKKTECPRASDLSSAEEQCQGELCFRGRNIMMGYLAQPDMGADHVKDIEKKNAETIDKDGWLHSGDKGMITASGMVKITGRYKELIIGDGGENIAPVPIEDHVKKSCDGIGEIMMVGDKRKYNVALVTLKAVGANGEVPGTDDLDAGAKRVNPEVTTISGAMKDQKWIETITAAITSANDNSKVCPNNAFKIQKFCILPCNFSEEAGELTPTKKLKRATVTAKYSKIIEKLYGSEGVYIQFE